MVFQIQEKGSRGPNRCIFEDLRQLHLRYSCIFLGDLDKMCRVHMRYELPLQWKLILFNRFFKNLIKTNNLDW